MYLHHELREVAANRQTEALNRISTLHHLMRQSPGFVRSLACRYLGNVTQYAWLRTWATSEDHVAFRQTEPAMGFGRTRPEGLYWPLENGIAPDGHWQSVEESGEPDAGGSYLLRTVYSVPEDAGDAFVGSLAERDAIALESPGIISVVTFESKAESKDRMFLCLIRTNDVGAYRLFLESSQAAGTVDLARDRLLVTECYEIVEELRADLMI